MHVVTYAELPGLAGKEMGVSDWVTITQDMVNGFADLTGDHHWIHVDVERASKIYGAPIAHGWLQVSLIPKLGLSFLTVSDMSNRINYGADKIRFTNNVVVGSRVRLRQRLAAIVPKAGGLQLQNHNTIEIEGKDKPACHAQTLSVVFGPER